MNRYLSACVCVCVYKGVFVSHHNSSLLAMVPVELQHIFEGKITDDIGVEDKKRLVVDVEQLSGQCQRTRCGKKELLPQTERAVFKSHAVSLKCRLTCSQRLFLMRQRNANSKLKRKK